MGRAPRESLGRAACLRQIGPGDSVCLDGGGIHQIAEILAIASWKARTDSPG